MRLLEEPGVDPLIGIDGEYPRPGRERGGMVLRRAEAKERLVLDADVLESRTDRRRIVGQVSSAESVSHQKLTTSSEACGETEDWAEPDLRHRTRRCVAAAVDAWQTRRKYR